MPSFECLYLMQNSEISIVEIKRTDLSEHATPSEKFHWLKVHNETSFISPLTFSSMDSSGEIEERYFDEGFLKFNANTATFIEKYNSAQHQLVVEKDMNISSALNLKINVYLDQPNHAKNK